MGADELERHTLGFDRGDRFTAFFFAVRLQRDPAVCKQQLCIANFDRVSYQDRTRPFRASWSFRSGSTRPALGTRRSLGPLLRQATPRDLAYR